VNPDETQDAWALFESWYQAAVTSALALPEAFTLATVGLDAKPAARIVLYKGRSGEGLRFFSNYESRKGRELERTPFAAAVFHWPKLERQVRVEGSVERLPAAESDAYFATRPRQSQLGAWASPQSQRLQTREALEVRVAELERQFAGSTIPRPQHWGGYRLLPASFEFWAAADHRLNRRWLFSRHTQGWERTLLAP